MTVHTTMLKPITGTVSPTTWVIMTPAGCARASFASTPVERLHPHLLPEVRGADGSSCKGLLFSCFVKEAATFTVFIEGDGKVE